MKMCREHLHWHCAECPDHQRTRKQVEVAQFKTITFITETQNHTSGVSSLNIAWCHSAAVPQWQLKIDDTIANDLYGAVRWMG